jgi:sec-independent protein translocase protein TatA
MRLGFGEILVVLALALLFFGPSKLPQLGSSLGQALKSFKKGLSSLQDDVEGEPQGQSERKALPDERAERPAPAPGEAASTPAERNKAT